MTIDPYNLQKSTRDLAQANGSPAGQGGFAGMLRDAKNWMGKRNAPQIGANPYLGDWGTLIGQLQKTASGNMDGSVALGAYQQAHNQGVRDQAAMAAGGSAGQVRQAGMNVGRMNQGFAQGYSNARLQEQLAAQQSLQAALASAGNAWFMPQQANLNAMMQTPTNGQQLLSFLMNLGMGAGTLATGRK